MTTCLAHSSELLHLTFCFLLGLGIQRITGVFVVYTCVFAFLGLQSTCTAARDGSLSWPCVLLVDRL